MVVVTLQEMEKAFKRHRAVFKSAKQARSKTHLMILFYAVECGLKALYMRRNRQGKTDSKDCTGESPADFKHNLNLLLTRLGISDQIPKTTFPGGTRRQQLESGELHQAWRYGKKLEPQQEEKCVGVLMEILKKVDKELI